MHRIKLIIDLSTILYGFKIKLYIAEQHLVPCATMRAPAVPFFLSPFVKQACDPAGSHRCGSGHR